MTFSLTPRSRSPVLSICTQSEDAETLRAEIEAASTQQQKFKRHKTKHCVEPTIEEEESDLDTETDHHVDCHRCHGLKHAQEQHPHRLSRRSFSSSLQGITGTVRGELSSAKRFLKNTSIRQLQRIRTKSASAAAASVATKHTESQDVSRQASCKSSPQPAELSSDPLYHQLEDNQRTSMQSDDIRLHIPIFPDYQKFMPEENATFDCKSYGAGDLSSKSYSCDNCQQPIQGGDLYDFCVLCRPSDRILCITCARERKCRRHRSEPFNMDDLSSARNSPAPPYTQPLKVDLPGQTARLHPRTKNTAHSQGSIMAGHSSLSSDQSTQGMGLPEDRRDPGSGPGRSDVVETEVPKVLHALEQMASQHVSPSIKYRERSLEDREAKLRDQFAAVREERMAVKEQELLLREREQLSRERDALVIRNLQTLVTIQELSRNGFIGAQFPSMKKSDEDRPDLGQGPPHKPSPKPHGDNEGISLDNLGHEHQPCATVADVVAQAEATINDFALEEKHVRNRPGQKRKKDGQPNGSGSISPSNSTNTGRSTSSDQPDDGLPDDDDENEEDGSTPPKKQKQDPSTPNSPQRIFACPYSKYDRARYSPRNLAEKHYRGCGGHFLHDIPRLKQHLKRVHWRPEHHCPRCFKVFSNRSKLNDHFQQATACSKQECPYPEKMDEAQRDRIHVKRPRVPPVKLWFEIYQVLFPGCPLPDSPYAEEDEITPPTSAAPSSASPEEATQRMIEIFNNRLNKYKDKPGHQWVISTELRTLINTELVESMSELFNTMSVESTVQQDMPDSLPPSIIVSPVTPPLGPNVAPLKQQPSLKAMEEPFGSRSSSSSVPSCPVSQPAPLLKEPKLQLSPALRNPRVVPSRQASCKNTPLESRIVQPGQVPTQNEHIDHNVQLIQNSMAQFPNTPAVDNGWDDQSGSFQQGDDLAMTMMMVPSAVHIQGLGEYQAPKPVRPPGNRPSFVPVRLETLEDSTSLRQSTSHQLQPNKSIASLVDSGYGSGNSIRPTSHADLYDMNEEMSDEISPIGHSTFEDELDLLQSSGAYLNPWQQGENPSYSQ